MKKLCLFLLLFWVTAASCAAAEEITLQFSQPILIGGSHYDFAHEAIPHDDGGLLLYGFTGSKDGTFSDNPIADTPAEYLLRLDADGNTVFSLYYWEDHGNNFPAISKKPEDEGYTLFVDSLYAHNVRFWSLDAQGARVSELNYLEGDEASNIWMYAAARDGALLLSGDAQETEAYGTNAAPFLTLVDAHGNTLWRRVYEGLENYQFSYCVPVDDGYLLCGSNHGTMDPFAAKVDENGTLLYCTVVAGDGSISPVDIKGTNDGGAIMIGNMQVIGGAQWIFRFDSEGNLLFSKECNDDDTFFYHSIQMLEEGFLLVPGVRETSSLLLKQYDEDGNHINTIEYPLGTSVVQANAIIRSLGDRHWLIISDGDIQIIPFSIHGK